MNVFLCSCVEENFRRSLSRSFGPIISFAIWLYIRNNLFCTVLGLQWIKKQLKSHAVGCLCPCSLSSQHFDISVQEEEHRGRWIILFNTCKITNNYFSFHGNEGACLDHGNSGFRVLASPPIFLEAFLSSLSFLLKELASPGFYFCYVNLIDGCRNPAGSESPGSECVSLT